MTSCSVFWRRFAGSFEARPVSKVRCKKKPRSLERLGATGGTEATPYMTAQGDRKLGANGRWRTLWSEERLVVS